jgi:hypothetical protein
MASPIAGNESFTTVENTVGQLDRLNVADVRAFDLVTQNLLIEDNARISSLKPSLEGLTTGVDDVAEGATVTITTADPAPSNYLIANAYTGAGGGAAVNTTVILPAAVENATVVMLFTTANAGNTGNLIINCAAGEVFLAGTTLKSAGVTVVQSVAGDNTLTYTPDGTPGDNLLNQSSRLYFMCTNAGVWRMNFKLNLDENTNAGTFAFSQ